MASDESEIEASRAPLMDHLIELRGRLIICAAALAVGFVSASSSPPHIYIFLLPPFEHRRRACWLRRRRPRRHGAFDLLLALLGLKHVAGVHVSRSTGLHRSRWNSSSPS